LALNNNNSFTELRISIKKLNAEMKTLICELDDLPTPVLGSPVDDHVTTSEEVKVKEETTPESTGGRSVYTKALYCRSLFVQTGDP
jgi:hypothetical protein